MSWWIKKIGSPAAIKAVVAKEQYMPQGVKDSIYAVCDAAGPNEMVFVESNGHLGTGGSNHKTSCETIVNELEPAPPVSNANVAAGCEQFTAPPEAPKEGAV